jgi:hypothetical protein
MGMLGDQVRSMPIRGQSWSFDDIPQGYVHVFGAAALTAEDIALFHDRFAPFLPPTAEPIPALMRFAAQAHVFALWSRMFAEETKDWPILARLGQDALRWSRPVLAGDVLQVRMEFVAKEPMGPDRGILIAQHEVLNQDGELVMALMTRTIIARG